MGKKLDSDEFWIQNYKGLYSVTKDGKVYSYYNGEKTELSQAIGTDGHPFVILCKDGQKEFKNVHRIMGEVFLEKPEKAEVVRHLDGQPDNNVVKNLKWGSQKDNVEDMLRHGNQAKGEEVKAAKCIKDDILEIRFLYGYTDKSQGEVASEYNISQRQVSSIVNGEQWKHVGGPIKGQDY